MPLGLRPGISFCDVGGRYLFLDVTADRYFGMNEGSEQAIRLLVAGIEKPDDPTVKRLRAGGMLVEATGDPFRPCPPVPHPMGSLLDAEKGHSPVVDRLSAFTAIARARWSLKRRGLGSTLDRFSRRKSRLMPSPPDNEQMIALASAFDGTARLMRSHDQCLVRSIAIAECLVSRAVAATLIIGVRVRPFAAHCWVQIGAMLANDREDQVTSYTPILIL